jgi:RNA polymerase primary sigma factor
MTEALGKLARARVELMGRLGREPTPEELAGLTQLSTAKVHVLKAVPRQPVSLDVPVGDEETTTLSDFLEDRAVISPVETLVAGDVAARVRRMLDRLSAREREIVRARFGIGSGEPQTLEQIGGRFSLTRERIRQIETRALAKLRRPALARIFADSY